MKRISATLAASLLTTALILPGAAYAAPPMERSAGLLQVLLAFGAMKARAQATRCGARACAPLAATRKPQPRYPAAVELAAR